MEARQQWRRLLIPAQEAETGRFLSLRPAEQVSGQAELYKETPFWKNKQQTKACLFVK